MGFIDQSYQNVANQQKTPQAAPQAPWLNTALQVGGQIGGGFLGALGGGAAGALVPGADLTGVPEAAGGYAGAVGGAGVGAGVGNAFADFVRQHLLNDKTVNPQQTVKNSQDAAVGGAVGQAIGGPLGKVLGYVAHPIQPLIDNVDRVLANSSKKVNIGDVGGLLDQFEKQVVPQMQRDGFGPEAQATYNKLQSRVVSMAQTYVPHEPGVASTTSIGGLTVPIAAANGIKRDLYQLAKNTYSGIRQRTDVMSPLEQEGAAGFASLLRKNIGQQEPGVNLPNQVASTLYKVPDFLKGVAQVAALGNPTAAHAFQVMGGVPIKGVQLGLQGLGKAAPTLTQLLYGAAQGGDNGGQ